MAENIFSDQIRIKEPFSLHVLSLLMYFIYFECPEKRFYFDVQISLSQLKKWIKARKVITTEQFQM